MTAERRYGVAYEAEIYAGKVLSNAGRGSDQGILSGIEWAVANGCQVVSMSLGGIPGNTFSRVFERAARRALRAGTLIVAAAGNESRRRAGVVSLVAHPANCPSILAVAAVDANLGVADFSNRGMYADGGQVAVAGPGVAVYSSWPGAEGQPSGFHTISGTSMATPHVAGVAALIAEADPNARSEALKARLLGRAQRLEASSADVGAGLVQAPQ